MDSFETRRPDITGWRGVPFRTPEQVGRDGGKHDGGPMPPEAPREPAPQPKEEDNK